MSLGSLEWPLSSLSLPKVSDPSDWALPPHLSTSLLTARTGRLLREQLGQDEVQRREDGVDGASEQQDAVARPGEKLSAARQLDARARLRLELRDGHTALSPHPPSTA